MRSIRTTVSASIVITLRVYAGHNPPTITLTECLIPESDDVCEHVSMSRIPPTITLTTADRMIDPSPWPVSVRTGKGG